MKRNIVLFFILIYVIVGIFQFVAISDYFYKKLDWNIFFAYGSSAFFAYIPVIGATIASYSAIKLWHWDFLEAVLLYFLPIIIIFALLPFIFIAKLKENNSDKIRHKINIFLSILNIVKKILHLIGDSECFFIFEMIFFLLMGSGIMIVTFMHSFGMLCFQFVFLILYSFLMYKYVWKKSQKFDSVLTEMLALLFTIFIPISLFSLWGLEIHTMFFR